MRRTLALILLFLLLLGLILLVRESGGPGRSGGDPPSPAPDVEPAEPGLSPIDGSGDGRERDAGSGTPDSEDEGSTPPPPPADLQTTLLRVVDEEGLPLPDAFAELHHSGWNGVRESIEADDDGVLTIQWSRSRRDEVLVGAPDHAPVEPDRLPVKGVVGLVVLRAGYPLAGTVVTEDGVPVPGAVVTCDLPFLPDVTTETDEEGRFRIADLTVGEHSIKVWASGWPRRSFHLAAGDVEAKLALRSERVIRGFVVHPDGSPAADAIVRGAAGLCLTDQVGAFSLTTVYIGTHHLYATLGANPPEWSGVTVVEVPATGDAPEARIELSRKPLSFLRVRVVNQKGQPVSGVTVHPMGHRTGGPNRTDKEGRVGIVLSTRSGERVTVRASGGAYQTPGPLRIDAEAVTAAEPGGSEFTIRLPSPVLLTFIALGPRGEPLPEGTFSQIELGVFEHWKASRGDAPTGRDRASFWVHPNDPIGDQWRYVKVVSRGFLRYQEPFEIPEGGGEIELRLVLGTSLSGRLVGGRPPPGESLGIEVRSARHVGYASEIAEDGRFTVEGLPPGPATVVAFAGEGLPVRRAEVDLGPEPNEIGDIILGEPVILRGLVTDAASRPLGGVRVRVMNESLGYSLRDRETFTRADGTFQMKLPPFDDVTVLADKEGYGSRYAAVPAGGVADDLRFPLPPGGSVLVRGVKSSRTTKGSSRSYGARFPGEEWTWQSRFGATGQGAWLMTGLPPGDIVVFVESMGGRNEKTVRVVAGETVKITLEIP